MPEPSPPHQRVLYVKANTAEAQTILKALASHTRLRVLELLSDHVYNVSEIAEALDTPLSTVTLHLNALEEAGLVKTELQRATRGRQKICARTHDLILIELARGKLTTAQVVEYAMPIGAYVDCEVTATCGLASESRIIGLLDDAASFYHPERLGAQLLWFRQGYVEYRFPHHVPTAATLASLHFSLEIASEAPLHHPDWPSEITFWINQVEVGAWTSPADFGGERGVLTPAWWEDWNSQYGLLKSLQINEEGAFIDGLKVSSVALADLDIGKRPYVAFRIGVRADGRHVGGVNLFGRKFGNYPQDIVLRYHYH